MNAKLIFITITTLTAKSYSLVNILLQKAFNSSLTV